MKPTVVVIVRAEAGVRVEGATITSSSGADLSSLDAALNAAGASLSPMFREEPRLPRTPRSPAEAALPELTQFFVADVAPQRQLDLVRALQPLPLVDAAYLKPPAQVAVTAICRSGTVHEAREDAARLPPPDLAPAITPDFSARQGYLKPSPDGVDATFAWARLGGRGAGIRVIDVEAAWQQTHEDLHQGHAGVISGTPFPDQAKRDHGTAVLGEMIAPENGSGVTGICHDARAFMASVWGLVHGTAAAIHDALKFLGPGDIILIELHQGGPRYGFQDRPDQLGFIAMEWWPDVFMAVWTATERGVLVVSAAGNGAENLDDAIYDTNPSFPHGPFPSWWSNPFRRTPIDSGSIVVGAGAPPPGPAGNWGPDRSRLGFSNWGSCLDAQGWGSGVVTTGYSKLQNDPDENRRYTDDFAGTSSASPIVVGALACVQGSLQARRRSLWSPSEARVQLRTSGAAQQPSSSAPATERIGSRPDLRQLLASTALGAPASCLRSTPPSGRHVATYLGTDGHVRYLDADVTKPNAWTLSKPTQAAGSPLAAGDPVLFDAGATTQHEEIFFAGIDGHLHHLNRTALGMWQHRDLFSSASSAPRMAGNPSRVSLLLDAQGVLWRHLFYLGPQGRVQQLFGEDDLDHPFGKPWMHVDLHGRCPHAPRAVSDPIAWTVWRKDVPDFHSVAYRGVDNHIHQLWWSEETAWTHHDLGGTAWSSPAGTPALARLPNGQELVGHFFYFVGEQGHIFELGSLVSAWRPVDVTAACGAAPARGSVAVFTVFPMRIILYIGTDGALHEIAIDGINPPRWTSLTQTTRAPLPVAAASGYDDYGLSGSRVVHFPGVDGHLHRLSRAHTGTWSWVDLTAIAGG